jgi:hypothetical protein
VEEEITTGVVVGLFKGFGEWNTRRIQKARLRQMLQSKFEWRTLKELAAAIGKDEDHTKALLVEMRARPQAGNPTKWGLTRRVGTI